MLLFRKCGASDHGKEFNFKFTAFFRACLQVDDQELFREGQVTIREQIESGKLSLLRKRCTRTLRSRCLTFSKLLGTTDASLSYSREEYEEIERIDEDISVEEEGFWFKECQRALSTNLEARCDSSMRSARKLYARDPPEEEAPEDDSQHVDL
ncbi:hypothetical protein RF11_15058 [Thelohanellus kitauei]|uniref:Uncharacterized protein n=1 Tax=Thelohanellus kitauei TaxID=669202 RepID=A0A0C2MQA4_THEKT|nr:hypothetical protein RF11_15058 [Thelohanellus kitauei]